MDEMRNYWGGMLAQGSTTFWETYDPKEGYPERLAMYGNRYGKSLCHAWGSIACLSVKSQGCGPGKLIIGDRCIAVDPTKPMRVRF